MSSNAPDLTKIGAMPSPQNMNISTSIIEPIHHDESFCRFVLMNRGILHSNSKLQLALVKSGKEAFLPLNVGSHALIQRCVLKAGTKTISEVDDWNHLQAYRSMFMSNEAKSEREGVLTGRVGSYGYTGSDICIQNHREFNTAGEQTMQPYQSLNKEPTWQITLSDLFPWLKQTQLPLYCMKDQISIELYFAPAANRYWLQNGEAGGAYTFNTAQTKMIVDYIYYDQDSMDTYQRQIETKGLTIPYVDHVLIKNSITLATNAMTNYTRNLGCANRMVSKVIIANTNENQSTASYSNVYNSQWNQPTTQGDVQINLKYNDNSVWPRDLENQAHIYSLLTAAEGLPPFITKEEWDGSRAGAVTTKKFELYNQKTEGLVNAPKHYITLELNKGDRINSRGLDLNMTMKKFPLQSPTGSNLSNLTQRVWCVCGKIIVLKDGRISCSYS